MAMVITVGTELAAVNSIIYIIGEAPVSSLDGEPSVDVVNARRLLADESRKVQDIGWTFNLVVGRFVQSDAFSNQIPFRSSWLRVTDTQTESPYVNRGGLLYNRLTDTDLFPGGVTLNILEEVPFNELPYCYQYWITARAARRFNAGSFGDPGVDAEAARLEEEGRTQCNTFELDYGQYNWLQDTHVQQKLGRG